MSQDRGPNPAGYIENFVYGVLSLDSAYVRLADSSDNSVGIAPEAIYVETLVVPAGSTLDLNGIRLYVQRLEGSGTILGDSLTLVPPAVVVSPLTSPFTSEAGDSSSFSIYLSTRPQANVVINLDSSNPAEGFPSTSSVTFHLRKLDDSANDRRVQRQRFSR